MMEEFIEENDMIIMGDREEDHLQAISQNVSCIIVGLNIVVSEKVVKLAHEKNIVIIRSPYDTFNIARLINQSIPVSYVMKRDNMVTLIPRILQMISRMLWSKTATERSRLSILMESVAERFPDVISWTCTRKKLFL